MTLVITAREAVEAMVVPLTWILMKKHHYFQHQGYLILDVRSLCVIHDQHERGSMLQSFLFGKENSRGSQFKCMTPFFPGNVSIRYLQRQIHLYLLPSWHLCLIFLLSLSSAAGDQLWTNGPWQNQGCLIWTFFIIISANRTVFPTNSSFTVGG